MKTIRSVIRSVVYSPTNRDVAITWTPRELHPHGWRISYVKDPEVARALLAATGDAYLIVDPDRHGSDTIIRSATAEVANAMRV